MKKISLLIGVIFLVSNCNTAKKVNSQDITSTKNTKKEINNVMNNWHEAVANYDFDAYFNAMTDDAIFIGTDASENWTKKEFIDFAKPYFDKKKTWDFKPLERHVFLSKDGKTAWFDELLDTWMRVCRGSGVLIKQNNTWKIKHYVLSITAPNDSIKSIVKIKKVSDSIFIKKNFR